MDIIVKCPSVDFLQCDDRISFDVTTHVVTGSDHYYVDFVECRVPREFVNFILNHGAQVMRTVDDDKITNLAGTVRPDLTQSYAFKNVATGDIFTWGPELHKWSPTYNEWREVFVTPDMVTASYMECPNPYWES